MNDGLIWSDPDRLASGTPATHAIVIGVGAYPHLLGGSGPLSSLHGNLHQLSSPPASARAVANWLLDEFHNPDRPLATLRMLATEENGRPYTHARLDSPASLEAPNYPQTRAALKAWKKNGDSHEDNMVLLYFCGHGVARGLEGLTLLLSDYGADPDAAMDGALDFSAFQRGMAQCAASRQCFFVDACRSVTDIAQSTNHRGQFVIQDNTSRPYDSDWNYAVLYSTTAGERAYGRRDKPSFYAEELIKALNGTAANNRNADGLWRVNTGELNAAIHHGLSRRGDQIKNPAVRLVAFDLHILRSAPLVPVHVSCDPRDDTAHAQLSCERNGAVLDQRAPQARDWVTQLHYGAYDFIARIGAKTGRREGEFVFPPYREIAIRVNT